MVEAEQQYETDQFQQDEKEPVVVFQEKVEQITHGLYNSINSL